MSLDVTGKVEWYSIKRLVDRFKDPGAPCKVGQIDSFNAQQMAVTIFIFKTIFESNSLIGNELNLGDGLLQGNDVLSDGRFGHHFYSNLLDRGIVTGFRQIDQIRTG
jgi:hypothetical protein